MYHVPLLAHRSSIDRVAIDSSKGGLSYFAKEGFKCDSVVSYEIVLADGSIVNVTSTSHQDLWLALKVGSNNFRRGDSNSR